MSVCCVCVCAQPNEPKARVCEVFSLVFGTDGFVELLEDFLDLTMTHETRSARTKKNEEKKVDDWMKEPEIASI